MADYLKHFKASKDVATTQAGDAMFLHYVQQQNKKELDELEASSNLAPLDTRKKKSELLRAFSIRRME